MSLPFDPSRLSFSRIAYTPGSPPALPPFHADAKEIYEVYPLFVSALVEVIQGTAEQNPLRVFMFNQMASNNWVNADFREFVEQASIYFSRLIASNSTPKSNDSITKIANAVCSVRAAKNAELYHGLRSYIDVNLVNDIQNAAKAWSDIVAENRPAPVNSGWGAGPGRGDAWGGAAAPARSSWGAAAADPAGWRGAAPSSASPAASSRASWVGADANPVIHRAAPVEQPMMRATHNAGDWRNTGNEPASLPAWATDAPTHVVAAPPAVSSTIEPIASFAFLADTITHQDDVTLVGSAPVSAPAPAPTPAPTPVPPTAAVVQAAALQDLKHWKDVKFIPSKRWFATIAFNPNTHDLFYRIHPDGSMQPVIVQKETSKMDYKDHIGTLAYAPTAPLGTKRLDIDTRQNELIHQLKDPESEINQTAPVGLGDVVEVDRSWVTSAPESIWLYNQIKLNSLKKTGDTPRVFRQSGTILANVVTTKSLAVFITGLNQKLSTNTTQQPFSYLAKYLKATEKQIDAGTDTPIDAVGLNAVNRRLTHFVNQCVWEEFGRRSGTIDNFAEDIDDLLAYFEGHSTTIYTRFVAMQNAIITRALQILTGELADEENLEAISDLDLPDDWQLNVDFFITHFYEQVSFTSTDIYAKELTGEFANEKHSVLIVEKFTPLLYAMADNIFKYHKACDNFFDRHLVRTADDVTLVISLSPTGGDNYMVGVA